MTLFNLENKYRKPEVVTESTGQLICGVLERVSTTMQAEDGDSLDMQRELSDNKIKEIGGILYNRYTEDGLSASKNRIENRPKMQELMQDVANGKVNYVIAYKRDRLFRNAKESLEFIQFIADHNCEIHLTARGETQIDLTSFKASGASKMMEVVLAMIAEMESATTSVRVSDTMINKARKGERTGGQIPIGYELVDEVLVPIEEGREIIKAVEDLYLQGVGMKSIARWLNGGDVHNMEQLEAPIPKPMGKMVTENWNEQNIKTILFNPIYTGHLSYQSKKNTEMDRIIVKTDVVVPMRAFETQARINALRQQKTIMKRPPRAYSTPFLLSGLLVCAECGEKYKTMTSQKKCGKRHSYYRCANRYSTTKKRCTKSRTYRKEVLESFIITISQKYLKEFLDGDTYEVFQKKIKHDGNIANDQLTILADNIKSYERKLDNISDLVSDISDDVDLIKVYLGQQRKILTKLNDMKDAYAKMSDSAGEIEEDEYDLESFLELAEDFGEIMASAPIGIQKQLIENLFTDIHVDKLGDVRMSLRIGVSKRENHVEDTVIPLETVGEPTIAKDIIVSSNEWTVALNYFDYLKSMLDKASQSFYPFLKHTQPLISAGNYRDIPEEFVKSLQFGDNIAHSSRPEIITKQYFEHVLDIKRWERKRIEYGYLPQMDKLKLFLNKVGTSVEEFIEYTKDRHLCFNCTEDLLEGMIESEVKNNEYIFQNLITCECGEKYVGIRNAVSVRYRCVHNRSDIKNRCLSKTINEGKLIELIERKLGIIFSEKVLKNKVESISMSNNNTIPIFHFKRGERNEKEVSIL